MTHQEYQDTLQRIRKAESLPMDVRARFEETYKTLKADAAQYEYQFFDDVADFYQEFKGATTDQDYQRMSDAMTALANRYGNSKLCLAIITAVSECVPGREGIK